MPTSERAPPGLIGEAAFQRWTGQRVSGLLFLAGCAWASILFLRSPGTPLQDEIGHFLIARDAWASPELILDLWGKPVNTLLYMVPALFGLPAARLFTLGLSILTVLCTMRLARQLGVTYNWLVPLFCWFQPWFARLSFTAITEVPFYLAAVAGWMLLLDRRLILAGISIGVLPLIRHEGLLLVALWLAVCVYRREMAAAVGSLLPLVAYNVAFRAAAGWWPVAIYFRTHPNVNEVFGSSDWFHFGGRLFLGAGPPVALLALAAVPALLKSRDRIFIFGWYAAYLAAHVVMFRFGLFASGGYQLYLLPLAPPIAIAAALGLEAILSRVRERGVAGLAPTTAVRAVWVATVVAVVGVGLLAQPHRPDREQVALEEAATWIREQGLDRERIVATHVWFYYYLPLRVEPRVLWSEVPRLESLPRGTVVVWDDHYSDRWGLDRGALTSSGAWTALREMGDGTVLIFQKR